MKIFPLNIARLVIHATITFLLTYLAYTPEIVMSEGLHEKAETFAREAGAEFTTRLRSVSEANELNGVIGMIDAMTGHTDGLAGLVTSSVRDMIKTKLPPRVALNNPDILQWASFGALVVVLSSLVTVFLWSTVDEPKKRALLGVILLVPMLLVALFCTQILGQSGIYQFDSWNMEIYGVAGAIILGLALFGRPLPNFAAGLLALTIYAVVSLVNSGQLPGAHNKTLAAADSLSDIKTNLIDPKMAELAKIPIAGPMIVDFVDQIWRSPDYQQEIEAVKKQTDVAAGSLRTLGIAEIAAGWLEVLVICTMLNIAVVAVSRDLSLLRSARAAAFAVLPGSDTP